MKKSIICIATAMLALSWQGCGILQGCAIEHDLSQTKAQTLSIANWNVHNLFDGKDDGFEYAEFTGEGGWNNEKYQARLVSISASVMDHINPDILALIEVENHGVIEDLADQLNKSAFGSNAKDYKWTFFAASPDSSIGLGVISRFPLIETKAHSAHSALGSVPRPVAEVRVDTHSGHLVLLICHWKSKVGGADKTEPLRITAAGIVERRLEELATENPNLPVIILGDLNESHDEFSRIGGAYPCALVPDTEHAARLVNTLPGGMNDVFLLISRQKPPRSEFFNKAKHTLYSPWTETEFNNRGSYYYQGNWETIDHFLLNTALFDDTGWEYQNFVIAEDAPFTNAQGIPYSYNPRTGNGLSDHLPIVLLLERK